MGRKLRLAAFAAAAALSIASAGCTLTRVVFGRDKRDVYDFRPSFGIDSPAFRRSLDTFGNSMTPGNRVAFLVNGDEIFPAMTRAIREAKLSVDLESYVFDEGRAGNLFADALCAAARRGMPVRVLVDAVGSSLGALKPRMKAAGVKIYEYAPTMMHCKTMVADGIYATIGSINFDARSMRANQEESLAFYDKDVAARLEAIFRRDLERCRRATLAARRAVDGQSDGRREGTGARRADWRELGA
jgi:phosphatidylserine/phosphatidylglycerophosphate/cardiolipin synthase-like enzyme